MEAEKNLHEQGRRAATKWIVDYSRRAELEAIAAIDVNTDDLNAALGAVVDIDDAKMVKFLYLSPNGSPRPYLLGFIEGVKEYVSASKDDYLREQGRKYAMKWAHDSAQRTKLEAIAAIDVSNINRLLPFLDIELMVCETLNIDDRRDLPFRPDMPRPFVLGFIEGVKEYLSAPPDTI